MLVHRWLSLALALAATASFADPIADGVNYLRSRPSGGDFGISTGEESVVATSEALLALRAAGAGSDAEALAAESFLAALNNDVDFELALRRQRALANTALIAPFSALATHGPGFEADDPAVIAHALLVFVVRTS